MNTRTRFALPLLALIFACGQAPTPAASPEGEAGASPEPSARTPLGSVGPALRASAAVAPASPAPVVSAFGSIVRTISEPDGPFFSDNTISNETSYLQVAAQLRKLAAPGGAYIGVGPEQNFTYLALTRPKVAFIVDIRRQNMIELLLYKAIFEEATSRAHFAALLLGRAHDAAGDPGPGASIEQVLAHAEKSPPDEAVFAASHARLRAAIERELPLDANDKKTLEVTHRSFLKKQLAIRFELKPANGRVYPTLRDLLTAREPSGDATGFLASEEAFRFVQTMEREGRIIPVVGDFAGDRAMPGIAAHLAREKLTVTAFYTSNVEQYLFEPKVWSKWVKNVAGLPVDDKSVFIRCYLDQGEKHPLEMKGHRTATVLQRIADFNGQPWRKPPASFLALTREKVLGEGGAARDL